MALVRYSRMATRRFIRWMLTFLLIALLGVVVMNNLVFNMMKAPERVNTTQMIPGWGRIYKPIMYDELKPELVSFGYSWVRDIFDPELANKLTGKTFFNFGVSGASSFESYRFIQSSLAYHVPERAFLDIRAFRDAPRARLMKHQFDERILHVNRDGSPNSTAPLFRWFKINTAGAALAFNLRFLEIEWALRNGSDRESLLPPYQRRDWGSRSQEIAAYKKRITEPSTSNFSGQIPSLEDLKKSVRLLCDAGVAVHVYDPPWPCSAPEAVALNDLQTLTELKSECSANMTFHVFGYPNAVTMEGLATGIEKSTFYRPDGHPRPPVGQLVLTRILNLQGKAQAATLPNDFGEDLLAMPDANAKQWIKEKAARCNGQWAKSEFSAILEEMNDLHPEWMQKE